MNSAAETGPLTVGDGGLSQERIPAFLKRVCPPDSGGRVSVALLRCFFISGVLWFLYQLAVHKGGGVNGAAAVSTVLLVCMVWVHQWGVIEPVVQSNEWIWRSVALSFFGFGSGAALGASSVSLQTWCVVVGVWILAVVSSCTPVSTDWWLGSMVAAVVLMATLLIGAAPWLAHQHASGADNAKAVENIILVATFFVIPLLGIRRYRISTEFERQDPTIRDPERYGALERTFWCMWGTLIFAFGAVTTGVVALTDAGNRFIAVNMANASHHLSLLPFVAVSVVVVGVSSFAVLLSRPRRILSEPPWGTRPLVSSRSCRRRFCFWSLPSYGGLSRGSNGSRRRWNICLGHATWWPRVRHTHADLNTLGHPSWIRRGVGCDRRYRKD